MFVVFFGSSNGSTESGGRNYLLSILGGPLPSLPNVINVSLLQSLVFWRYRVSIQVLGRDEEVLPLSLGKCFNRQQEDEARQFWVYCCRTSRAQHCLEMPVSCKLCKGMVVQISQGPAGCVAVLIWVGEDKDVECRVWEGMDRRSLGCQLLSPFAGSSWNRKCGVTLLWFLMWGNKSIFSTTSNVHQANFLTDLGVETAFLLPAAGCNVACSVLESGLKMIIRWKMIIFSLMNAFFFSKKYQKHFSCYWSA